MIGRASSHLAPASDERACVEHHKKANRVRIAALAVGGVLAGGAALGAVGVMAANATPVLTAASPSSSASTSTKEHKHGAETAVTGAKAETLKAAALKAVPGATVERVETDSDGAAYEVHLKKADESRVTVKFNSALKQTAIETAGRFHHDHRRSDSGATE